MTAQEFANAHNVFCAMDSNGTRKWFAQKPIMMINENSSGYFARVGWSEYGDLTPDVRFEKGIFWQETLTAPKPRIEDIRMGQKIMVRSGPNSEWKKRYFRRVVEGEIYCFRDGATKWSAEVPVMDTMWREWRLPTPEEAEE